MRADAASGVAREGYVVGHDAKTAAPQPARLSPRSLASATRAVSHLVGQSREPQRLFAQLLLRAVESGDESTRVWAQRALDDSARSYLRPSGVAGGTRSQSLTVLQGHVGAVWWVSPLGDGRVASAGDDGTIRVWDPDRPDRGAIVFRVPESAGRVLATCALGDGRLVSAGDRMVRIWDPDEPQTSRVIGFHPSWVWAVCAVGDGRVASAGGDGTVRVWHPDRLFGARVLSGHHGRVMALCSLGGGRVASAGDDGTVRLWEVDRRSSGSAIVSRDNGQVLALCALPGDRLAWAGDDGTVQVVDGDGTELVALRGPDRHVGRVEAVCGVRGGRVASAGDDGTVRVWDPARPDDEPDVFRGHAGRVWGVCSMHDRLISTGDDATVRVWDLARGEPDPRNRHAHAGRVWGVCRVDSHRMASAGADGTIRVWDRARPDDAPIVSRNHVGPVWAVCDLGDGQIASAGDDGTVRICRAATPDPDPSRSVDGPEVGPARWRSSMEEVATWRHGARAWGVCALGDGRVACAGDDGVIHVWRPSSPTDEPVTLSCKGTRAWRVCAVGATVVGAYDDGKIRAWDGATDGTVARVLAEGLGHVFGMCSVGDRGLLAGGADGIVRLWRLGADDPVPTVLGAHPTGIWAACELDEGLVAVIDQHELRVWKVEGGDEAFVTAIGIDNPHALAAVGPRTLVTGHADGRLIEWELVAGARGRGDGA